MKHLSDDAFVDARGCDYDDMATTLRKQQQQKARRANRKKTLQAVLRVKYPELMEYLDLLELPKR